MVFVYLHQVIEDSAPSGLAWNSAFVDDVLAVPDVI